MAERVQLRYVQPDGRGVMKRKWGVDKDQGPAVLLAEWLVKEMIRSKWPCEVVPVPSEVDGALSDRVIIRPLASSADLAAFWAECEVTLKAVVAMQKALLPQDVIFDRGLVLLRGVYHVNPRGQVRPGVLQERPRRIRHAARLSVWRWQGPGT